ncbi:MAG: hypothetical protein M9949_14890 [Candidatus Kapabacteria bacterium]|nr:hypothetical protein [Candidatus Kapabacteria bacterium]
MKIILLFLIVIQLNQVYTVSKENKADVFELKNYIIQHYDNCLEKQIIDNMGFRYNGLILISKNLSKEDYNSLNYVLNVCEKQLYDTISKNLHFRAFFDSLDIFKHMEYIVDTLYYSHIKQINLDFLELLDSLRNIYWYLDSIDASWVVLDSIDGCYIPTDIYDCISDLKEVLSVDDLEKIKNYENAVEASNWEHFGISSMFRFRYKLWGLGSRLATYFEAFRIKHGDHRSSIIMQSLWYDLNDKPIPFKEIIYQHRWYQKTMEKPYNKLAE